ncbi:MAG: S8 family serine peptidase [Acidobacteriota bacterium]|nr:S8 family serine peptidase [Acidobacteriota bacterium]
MARERDAASPPKQEFYRAFRRLVLTFGSDQQFTQATPILPDVWMAFIGDTSVTARRDGRRLDLIVLPHYDSETSAVANHLHRCLGERQGSSAQVAALRAEVAAWLTFEEVLRVVLPITGWWRESHGIPAAGKALRDAATKIVVARKNESGEEKGERANELARRLYGDDDQDFWRFMVLAVLVLAHSRLEAGGGTKPGYTAEDLSRIANALLEDGDAAGAGGKGLERRVEPFLEHGEELVKPLLDLLATASEPEEPEGRRPPLVWTVNLNRPVALTLDKSRRAIKADAAESVFHQPAGHIRWAIVDSGVDARHPGFARRDQSGAIKPECWRRSKDGKRILSREGILPAESRVVGTYDFGRLRGLLGRQEDRDEFLEIAAANNFPASQARSFLEQLSPSVTSGRSIDWALAVPFLRVPDDPARYEPPAHSHGTHVAGIIGCDLRQSDLGAPASAKRSRRRTPSWAAFLERRKRDVQGVCRDICLYDLRVFDAKGESDEFTILAALQFISHLNRDRDLMQVHGVNLSLSLVHNVTNFACGQTPICKECDRLVAEGVVVVAAAGNNGYGEFRTKAFSGGLDDYTYRNVAAYNAISITDPGNAQEVITVGSTHRSRPHAYGVSYFSSRGPTGDGRRKPDLLAPGERIEAPVVDGRFDSMDGTSMAAPHVSGAAAMLMARHGELIGQPRRVKETLCATATDLGRDPYFQGAGLVDILRALQSI